MHSVGQASQSVITMWCGKAAKGPWIGYIRGYRRRTMSGNVYGLGTFSLDLAECVGVC